MAEGRPDWGAALRNAVAKPGGGGQPGRQAELKGKRTPIRDGHHSHTHPDGDDGNHHHQDLQQKILDHGARLKALEAHVHNVVSAHEGHSGDGSGDGPS